MSIRAKELVEDFSFQASGDKLLQWWEELIKDVIAVVGDAPFRVNAAPNRDGAFNVTVSYRGGSALIIAVDPKLQVKAGQLGSLRPTGVHLTARGWKSTVKDEETVPEPGKPWPVKEPVLVLTEVILGYYKGLAQ